jgi:protein phosphatase
MMYSWAAASDRGRRRSSNEDSFGARPDLGLFIVADGMGGRAAGEVASRLAVQEIEAAIEATANDPDGPDRAATRLRTGFDRANQRIAEGAAACTELRGMATTAVAVLLTGTGAILAHVGDSRLYLWRDGRVERLTADHSWVEEQVRAGTLDVAAAREHPWRNLVTRAIGGPPGLVVDVSALTLQLGDRLLLCTDGLFSVLPDTRIAAILGCGPDLSRVCHDLVGAANAGGGPDNVTVLVVETDAR